jgi:peptidoglycan/xylan/chitin deacetylase (PgdA/CDA1 family)
MRNHPRKKVLWFIGFILIGAGLGAGVFAKKTPKTPNVISFAPAIVSATSTIPVPAIPQVSGQSVTILTYHSVEPKTDKKEGVMQKHYHIYPENFEAQMQYLKDNNYHPITMKQLTDSYKNGTGLPEKSVVLTFDDGWKNQYTYAFPILKKFGYSATFFIITKVRGGTYMTWDEIRAMDQAGMDIESHSETHPKLTKISADKALQEIAGSKKTLETELGHTIDSIAYPYYDHNAAVMKIVEDAGYGAARAGWGKLKNGQENRFALVSQEVVNNKNPFSSKVEK